MTDSPNKRLAAYSAAGLVVLIALLLAIFWLARTIFPAGPGNDVATGGARPLPASPAEWHRAYAAAVRGGNIAAAAYTVGTGHVTCSAIGPRGELMIGTEDEGVFIYDPTAGPRWRSLTEADGLADPAVYALATDSRGRVWIGHGNGGLSVWNGKDLQHYPVGQGPLGDRVFSIAVGPDHSVWLATSAGLTRYDDTHSSWRHYTTAQGLPGLQAAKLAFAPNGKLYAAMQSAGLAVATPDDDYAHFNTIEATAPDKLAEKSGQGLPSNLCNDVAITPQGHIYVATCYGLARSLDDGQTFCYFRGDGWSAQKNPDDDGAPRPGKTTSPVIGAGDLQEDFIAALAADANGRIYVAYRDQGGQIIQAATADPQAPPQLAGALDCEEATSMLVTPGGDILVTQAKFGARILDPGNVHPSPFAPIDPAGAPLPPAAAAPSLEELTTLLNAARAVEPDPRPGPLVMTLPDDWTTQGAYLGRHGKYLAALAAMVSPSDLIWGTGADRAHYGVTATENALRFYVHSNYTDDPSALELPMPYLDTRVRKELTTWDIDRREAEWNDFGGGPARARDGPNVYVGMHVPPGLFIMALYFHNKDGHSESNSFRDYDLSVRPAGRWLTDTSNFADRPELARSRVHLFWHGVYKQFLVRGPIDLQVEVGRNHSHMAVIAGAMLDEVDEKSTAYFATNDQRQIALAHDEALQKEFAGRTRAAQPPPATADQAADALLAELDTAKAINPRWWGQNHRQFYEALLRFYDHQPAASVQRRHATCCYYLQLFEAWESDLAATGQPVPRAIEKALRWPGNNDSYPTENYELVRKSLASPTPEKPPQDAIP